MKNIITSILLLNCYLLHVIKKLVINSMIIIVILPVSIWSQLPFVENFDGETTIPGSDNGHGSLAWTEPAGWTFPNNWQVGNDGWQSHVVGNPFPAAFFYWAPT